MVHRPQGWVKPLSDTDAAHLLKMERDALRARINELEAERDTLRLAVESWKGEAEANAEIIKGAPWYSDIAILQTENARLRKQLDAAMRVVNAARDWKHRSTERGAELVQRVFDAVDAYDKRKEAKRHMELSKVLDDDRDANTDATKAMRKIQKILREGSRT